MKVLQAELKARSYELDSLGHVNNSVFLQYLEAARCDYLNQLNLSFNDFKEWDAFPLVTKANLEFRQPVLADDILVVSGWLSYMKKSTLGMEFRVTKKGEERVVLEATMDFLFVNSRGSPVRIPEPFAKAFGG